MNVAQANQAGIAASQDAGYTSTVFPVGSPQVSVLAPGGVLGSKIQLRLRCDVPNFPGGLTGLFPGLPSGPFHVTGDASMRQEGWLQRAHHQAEGIGALPGSFSQAQRS